MSALRRRVYFVEWRPFTCVFRLIYKGGNEMVKNIFGIFAIVIIVVVIGYAALTFSASSSCSRNVNEKQMPNIESPYYLVTTVPPGLIYAAKDVKESSDWVVLEKPYYVKMGGSWELRDGGISLRRAAYKEIKVTLLPPP